MHPSAPDLAGHKRQFGSVCHQDPRSVLLRGRTAFVHGFMGCGAGGEGTAPLVVELDRCGCQGDKARSDHILASCRVCDEPSSEDPHEWPDDITKWPVSYSGRVVWESPLSRGVGIHTSPVNDARAIPIVGPPCIFRCMFLAFACLPTNTQAGSQNRGTRGKLGRSSVIIPT